MNGHEKNAQIANDVKNCLHHWPVRKTILVITNSSTPPPPQRSNGPPLTVL